MNVNVKLLKPKNDAENQKSNFPYRQLKGALSYLFNETRKDISFAVNCLSEFNTCFRKEHRVATKRIFRYLTGTKD